MRLAHLDRLKSDKSRQRVLNAKLRIAIEIQSTSGCQQLTYFIPPNPLNPAIAPGCHTP